MMWTLILFIHAGPFSDHDSVALTNVPNFISQQECQAAGVQSSKLTNGTMKVSKFICVKVGK
jgi:hypothetical protein